MNKKITSLSIIGICSLFLAGCTLPGTTKPEQQSVSKTISEAEEFAKAIESGKPTICSITKGSDVMEYSIKGKKMRIKTTNTISDEKGVPKTTVGHMINNEEYFYAWDDVSKQGSKISLLIPSPSPIASLTPTELAPKFGSQADYDSLKNEGYTINCKTDSIDDSIFTPPSDIKFIDPTEVMKGFPSPKADGTFDAKQLEEIQKQYGGE